MRIRPAKFVHVVYHTRRFEQMLQWYKIVFGAKVQYQNSALAFLTYDYEHHRFAFANMAVLHPERTDTNTLGVIGVDHVAYTYASLRDLFETCEAERARDPALLVHPPWRYGVDVLR